MKKFLFVYSCYSDDRQKVFLEQVSPRNKKFCFIHGYEYIEITEYEKPFRNNFTWLKFTKVRDLIRSGHIKENDLIVNLDADMSIQKFDSDFPNDKTFSYSIDNGNTHCMGNYSLRLNEWGISMIENLLCEKRYELLKDVKTKHELFGHFSSFWQEFREQASWYSLAGIKRHSQKSFFELENYGWHSDKNEHTIYELDELYRNVQILGPEWNTTIMPHESNGHLFPWFINKTDKNDIIIRHFAAGTKWESEYLTLI